MGGFMQFNLSFERSEVYEYGAALLAVLACAREVGEDRCLQLHLSLCGKALRLKHWASPDDWTPIVVKPQYVFRDRKTIERDVAYVAKRLSERMVAGHMAIALFKKAIGLQTLPKGIQRLSVNQMAEFVLDDAEQADASNVKRRIWAPSRLVIHLAAAAAIIGQQRSQSGQLIGVESFLIDRAFIEEVVRLAEELEAIIAKYPKFPVKPDQLIRFRLS